MLPAVPKSTVPAFNTILPAIPSTTSPVCISNAPLSALSALPVATLIWPLPCNDAADRMPISPLFWLELAPLCNCTEPPVKEVDLPAVRTIAPPSSNASPTLMTMSPAEFSVAVPVEIFTEPELAACPDKSVTSPELAPFAMLELMRMAPEVIPAPPRPLVTLMSPPVVSLLSPAVMAILPDCIAEVCTEKIISPALPLALDPVFTDTEPDELPLNDAPVFNSRAPLEAALLSPVAKLSSPLVDATLAPEVSNTFPPVNEVEEPASMLMEPPAVAAAPTCNTMPPEVSAEIPVDISTFPL